MQYKVWENYERTVMVRLWESGRLEVCTRPDSGAVWGPPEEYTWSDGDPAVWLPPRRLAS